MEARKLRDKQRHKATELEQKEKGFCAYVNGPNKEISGNKEIHDLKKQMQQNPIESQRKKWHSPPTVVPRIPDQEDYLNPVL